MSHDVAVIGATVAGLTAARRLAAEGIDVVVIDPNPPHASTAVGHGVAAFAHASTVANMRAAYGDNAVTEHVKRNHAGMEEIRRVASASGVPVEERTLHDHSLGFALDRELRDLVNLLERGGADVDLLLPPARRRAAAGIVSRTLCVNPDAYGPALAAQAVTAGAEVINDATIIKLRRDEGLSRIIYRSNIEWTKPPLHVAARAVIDTMGVSPWGQAVGTNEPQVVPTLSGRPVAPENVITLLAGPPVWMIRPMGAEALLLGVKKHWLQVEQAAEELARWAETEMLMEDCRPGIMTIDPSDHGRPIVGVSAIPGGYYSRGNGRGELINGTASGCWLASVLLGRVAGADSVALPRFWRARATVRGLLSQQRRKGSER